MIRKYQENHEPQQTLNPDLPINNEEEKDLQIEDKTEENSEKRKWAKHFGLSPKDAGGEYNSFGASPPIEIESQEDAELSEEELEKAKKKSPEDVEPTGEKYRVTEEDANRALEMNGMPMVRSEIENDIPPQWWLVPLNNGAFLLASFIPGLNIVFLPILLANLKILPMFSKEKLKKIASSQPTRKIEIKNKQNFGTAEADTGQSIGGAEELNGKTNFGTAAKNKQSFGTNKHNSAPVKNNFGAAAKNKQNFGTNKHNSTPAKNSFGIAEELNGKTNFGAAAKNKQSFGTNKHNSAPAKNSFGIAEELNGKTNFGTAAKNRQNFGAAAPTSRAYFGSTQITEENFENCEIISQNTTKNQKEIGIEYHKVLGQYTEKLAKTDTDQINSKNSKTIRV